MFDDTILGSNNTAPPKLSPALAATIYRWPRRLRHASYNNIYFSTGRVSVTWRPRIATGDASIGTDTLRSIEGVQGTMFADTYNATGYGLPGAQRRQQRHLQPVRRPRRQRHHHRQRQHAGDLLQRDGWGDHHDRRRRRRLGETATVSDRPPTPSLAASTAPSAAIADTYNASAFNNGFNSFQGNGGNDTITGNGATQVQYGNATSGVTITIGAGGSRLGDRRWLGRHRHLHRRRQQRDRQQSRRQLQRVELRRLQLVPGPGRQRHHHRQRQHADHLRQRDGRRDITIGLTAPASRPATARSAPTRSPAASTARSAAIWPTAIMPPALSASPRSRGRAATISSSATTTAGPVRQRNGRRDRQSSHGRRQGDRSVGHDTSPALNNVLGSNFNDTSSVGANSDP